MEAATTPEQDLTGQYTDSVGMAFELKAEGAGYRMFWRDSNGAYRHSWLDADLAAQLVAYSRRHTP